MSETIQFKIREDLDTSVHERLKRVADGERLGLAARRELERYTHLTNFSLSEVREIGFTEKELGLIAEIRNGVLTDFEVNPRSHLISDVAFAIEEGYAKKHKVNITAFQQKMSELTVAQAAALIDAIEHWWSGDYHDPDRQMTREGFAKVGLMHKSEK